MSCCLPDAAQTARFISEESAMVPKTTIDNKQRLPKFAGTDASSEIRVSQSKSPRVCWMTEATQLQIPNGIPQIVESFLSPFHPLRMRFNSEIDPRFLDAIDDKQQVHFDSASPAEIVKRPFGLLAVRERDGKNARWAVLMRCQPHDMGVCVSGGMSIYVEFAGTDRRKLNVGGLDVALVSEVDVTAGCIRYKLNSDAQFLLPKMWPSAQGELSAEDLRALPQGTKLIANDKRPWAEGCFSKVITFIRIQGGIVSFVPSSPPRYRMRPRGVAWPPIEHCVLRDLQPLVPHPFFVAGSASMAPTKQQH